MGRSDRRSVPYVGWGGAVLAAGFLALTGLLTASAAEPPDHTLPQSFDRRSVPIDSARPSTGESARIGNPTPINSTSTPAREHPLSIQGRTMTGDWGGVRSELNKKGVTVGLFVNQQFQSVTRGGLDTAGWGRSAASLDAIITCDLGSLGLIPDAEILVHAQVNWGHGINLRVGSLQQVNDDADGSIGLHVGQAWYRQHLFERRVSLAVGFLDFQTIFDRNEFANSEDKQFWNQALDNNPLIPLNIGLGAVVVARPVAWSTMILGVGDAQSVLYKPGFSTTFHGEDWFVAILEQNLVVSIPTARGSLPGTYRVGWVYDPRPKIRYARSRRDAVANHGDHGVYAGFDQLIYREESVDKQGWGVFLRFGYRVPETNTISYFWSGGMQCTGLIPGRDQDVLGIGFAQLRGSRLYRSRIDLDWRRESIGEIYYAIQVNPWLVVTPDVQYIDNPGARGDGRNVVVAGVRVRVTL